uniref:NID domain-containing protein n=1 Tax=Periophthalmus magnuspinnatus TaxID=409849 RepID=A0A3B4AL89_9GOBI
TPLTFQICADLPDKEVEFIKPKPGVDDVTSEAPIRGQFSVYQQGALLLKEGQALITFEEERDALPVCQMPSLCVRCPPRSVSYSCPRVLSLQIHLAVSRCDLDVSEVVSAMPNERVEDCLALSFSRPSRGGAEVQSVKFNPRKSTARIHFQRTGVAESLALRGEFSADLGFQTKVKVSPVFDVQLHKFQVNSCGVPKRTLLLDGIKDTGDEEEEQDQLEIHFQKPSNGGGEIEHTKYLVGVVLCSTWCCCRVE